LRFDVDQKTIVLPEFLDHRPQCLRCGIDRQPALAAGAIEPDLVLRGQHGCRTWRRARTLAFGGIFGSRCGTRARFRDVVAVTGRRLRQVGRDIERLDVAGRLVIDLLAFDQGARAAGQNKHRRGCGGD
jgi:hypothetical protein